MWGCWIPPLAVETVLGDRRLVDFRARQASVLVVHVGDHKLIPFLDLDEKVRNDRNARPRLGVCSSWRRHLPGRAAVVRMAALVGKQHHTIQRGHDPDVPARRAGMGGLSGLMRLNESAFFARGLKIYCAYGASNGISLPPNSKQLVYSASPCSLFRHWPHMNAA